jgi:hypothetical protein
MRRSASYLMRNIFNNIFVVAVALAVAICCSAGFAQSGAGSIQGTVTDSTGAVLPGASIHVVNQATGVVVDAKANSVGFYQVPGLFTGTYVVSITAPGMKTTTRTIELLVAQDAIVNAALTTGAVTQQVTVSANMIQLQTTDNGSITSTLENARINELPMNSRNLVSLVNEVTPGLESCPESSSCANGQEAPALEYEVDGATLANREYGGVHQGQNQMLDPDSVQEVRVEDNNAGAQYALPATAILSTKSGTNQLHGSAFWTARNNGFGIARTRNDQSTYSAPKLVRNEGGASIGGPIVLPHLYHGKDKTFFFLSYERYSQAATVSQNEYAPTQAMRGGDFSGLINSSNVFQQLYDPNTTAVSTSCAEPAADGAAAPVNNYCRQPFANNQVPTTRESPLTAILNQMTPLPTNSNNPMVGYNLSGLDPELTTEPQVTARVDHVFNENNRVYLRYTQNLTNALSPRNDPEDESYTLPATINGATLPAGVSGEEDTVTHVYAGALGYTHIFSPTFFSETVYSQTWYGEANNAAGSPFTDYEAEMGLPNNFGEPGFPYFESIFQPMDGTQWTYGLTATTYNVDENLTKTLSKHQVLFGGRYRFEHFGSRTSSLKDEINFDGYGTGLLNPSTYTASAGTPYSNSGQLNADEFIGAADSYLVNLEPAYEPIHDMEFDAYIQDNWHVRNNLTLNLGLRYEAHPAAWVGQGMMEGFDLKNDAIVTSGSLSQLEAEGLTTQAIINNDELDDAKFETPAEAGMPTMLMNNYDFTWGPRVGAAWQPFGKWGTVLRGGLGRYIYPVAIGEAIRQPLGRNPFTTSYSVNYNSAQYAPHASYMLLAPQSNSSSFSFSTTSPTASGGTPIMGVNSTSVINSSTPNAITPGLTIVNIDPDYPPTYVDEANFTIEQPIKWGSVLRVSYIYTHGTNLDNNFYYNDHPSSYSWEVQTGTIPPNSSAVGPTNSNTGEGPYDKVTYGSGNYQIQKSGWSNYHALQANYQKLYHSGSAWQIMYVWEKNLRAGGDFGGSGGDYVDPYSAYVNSGPSTVTATPAAYNTLLPPVLPPAPPTGTLPWQYYRALNRWENYMVDTETPPQHIQFNGLIDFPFGRGKRWLGNINKPLNEVVGGWQLAGSGAFTKTDFQITTTMWGPINPNSPNHPLKVYKKSAPITDCRTGNCVKSYEWFNGYIAPTALSGNVCSTGLTTVVSGLPTNWASYQRPGDIQCTQPVNGKTVTDTYYGGNEVIMNGVTGQNPNTYTAYADVPSNDDNGPSGGTIDVTNPFSHTVLRGPMNWSANASLYKVFPVSERVNLRMNVDAFNFFNNQGTPNPNGTDGTVCVTPGGLGCNSANGGRQLQFSLRINF